MLSIAKLINPKSEVISAKGMTPEDLRFFKAMEQYVEDDEGNAYVLRIRTGTRSHQHA